MKLMHFVNKLGKKTTPNIKDKIETYFKYNN